jgi:vacuolar protein sorting-associated protein 54
MVGPGMWRPLLFTSDFSKPSANMSCRMLRDAEFFKTRIGGLDGAGDAGDYIVNLVKAKSVPKAAVPEPPAPSSTNGKTGSEGAPSSNAEEEKVDEKNRATDENTAP